MALFSNRDSQAGQPKHLKVGQIEGIKIANDGTAMSGYVDGASLTIGAPPGGGVQAAGTIKVVGGVITGVTITNPGAGYLTAPTVTAPTGLHAVLTAGIAKNVYVNSEIVFVDSDVEATKAANRLKGIKTPGWYKITEKLQSDGTTRYLTENLVAMGSNATKVATSTDAKVDDAVVADVAIAITAQPANRSITAPAGTTFVVTATGTTLAYQWQLQTGGTGAFANITNGGVYTTATTATLNISNTTGLNGNRYRCIVTGAAGEVVKSMAGKLTVV